MAKKIRKSGNSMKRRSNGRYQMKKAMKHGRAKSRYKRQARKNPNYAEEQENFYTICQVVLFIIGIICWFIHLNI